MYTACVAAVAVPIASRLILPAADRYASISAGDIRRAPAMLSKPGRRIVRRAGTSWRSTSSPSRSRIDIRVLGAVETMNARRRQMRRRLRVELLLHPG